MGKNLSKNCVCFENRIVNVSDENLSSYVKEISVFKSLDIVEERDLAMRAAEGDGYAKQELIKANLKLVVAIAKKIVHSSNLPMIDLVQEGNLGLMVAVDKFNYKLGYRFSTYASWWIKQAIFKAISEQSHSMKVPVYIQETLSKYSKIKQNMEQETLSSVKVEEVAKKMNIEPDKIDRFLNAYSKTLSLDAECDYNGKSDVCLAEIIEDKRSSTNESVEYEALQNDIILLLNCLKDREKSVIRLRFGLNDSPKQTLEEIGKIYGVTKECIRQTEARALRKLKNTFGESLYYSYVV